MDNEDKHDDTVLKYSMAVWVFVCMLLFVAYYVDANTTYSIEEGATWCSVDKRVSIEKRG